MVTNNEKRIAREKEIEEKIKKLMDEEQIKEVFKLNHKKLAYIFELLIKFTYKGIFTDPRKKWKEVENKPAANPNQSKVLDASVAGQQGQ